MTTTAARTGGLLVLGASGMLGHALMHELTEGLPSTTVTGTVRSDDGLSDRFLSRFARRLVHDVDVCNIDSVAAVLADRRPEVVVNAVGVIKQAPGLEEAILTAQVNALLPHQLARECTAVGARLVQVSTDCVFSGRAGMYTEEDVPDPLDFYGRSKLLGEVFAPHVTLRTSIIGPELRARGSLLEWFLSQHGKEIKGFTRAVYSGLSTLELARVIASVVLPHPQLVGLWHVASRPITKFKLLELLAGEYGWDGRIIPDDDAIISDRSLSAVRFERATGYVAPQWPTMLREMHEAHRRWTSAGSTTAVR